MDPKPPCLGSSVSSQLVLDVPDECRLPRLSACGDWGKGKVTVSLIATATKLILDGQVVARTVFHKMLQHTKYIARKHPYLTYTLFTTTKQFRSD